MKELKIPLSNDLIKRINFFSEINWGEIVKRAIVEKLDLLEHLNNLTSGSQLTHKDVEELCDKINSSAFKRFSC